jgi:hypothetical protein
MTRNEIVSRPKNRYRATAREATVPRSSAIAVAITPHFTESQSAARTSSSRHASPNQSVV